MGDIIVNAVFGLGQPHSEEELVEIRRKELRGLLTSYADEADIFTEIVQNALDSIKTKYENGGYKGGGTPTIDVFIGRRGSDDTNYFAVYDNGLGMDPTVAANFTVPGWGLKKRKGKTIGYKGVGASFFVAASDKFSLWARGQSDDATEYTVHGAWSWIMKETEPVPWLDTQADLPVAVRESIAVNSPGAAVCYFLHAGAKPKTLSLVMVDDNASVEIGRWAGFLCSKTALGQLANFSVPGVRVHIVLDRGGGDVHRELWTFGDFSVQDRKLGYPYPRQVYRNAKNIDEIITMPVPSRDALHYTLPAVYLRWSVDKVESLLEDSPTKLTEEQRDLIEEHLEFVDVFYAYSTKVLKDLTARLGTRSDVVRYGIKIGVDGVPQGRALDFSFTSSIGLERQMHAVIGFKQLELDIGRKIPADETVNEVVALIGNRIQSVLVPYRIYLKKDDKGDPAADLEKWRSATEAREEQSLTRKMFEALSVDPIIHVDPENENDTIALFAGLLAKGFVRGIRMRALSGINQYDGLVDIDVISPTVHDVSDPLEIGTDNVARGGYLKVLEFKHTFDDLMFDFYTKKKNPSDIDIVVVWDFKSLNFRRGTLHYWYEDQAGFREVHSATHVWRDDNNSTDIPIISLRHVAAILLASAERKAAEPATGVATLNLLLAEAKEASV